MRASAPRCGARAAPSSGDQTRSGLATSAGPDRREPRRHGPLARRPTMSQVSKAVSAVKQKNLDIYGDKPIPWSRALEQLDAGAPGTYWLATTRPDGRPHVAAVGALWIDGRIYFVTGAGTRKGRNLAQNASCV